MKITYTTEDGKTFTSRKAAESHEKRITNPDSISKLTECFISISNDNFTDTNTLYNDLINNYLVGYIPGQSSKATIYRFVSRLFTVAQKNRGSFTYLLHAILEEIYKSKKSDTIGGKSCQK